MRTLILSLSIVFSYFLFSNLTSGEPVGTAFSYQGRLIDANKPADGLYDIQFKLYDNISGGSQIGATMISDAVDIIDGYFTIELDFGYVFDGNKRWLEIGIRPGPENDPYPYTLLSPRQAIRPTPYTISTRGLYVDSDENVGIKTTHPHSALQVNGTIFGLGQSGCSNGDCPAPPPYTGVYGESVTGNGIMGVSPYGYAGHFTGNVNTQGNMYVSGSIGVKTSNPHCALQVNGTIFGLGQTGCTNGDCPVPPPYTGVYGESVTGDGIMGISPYGYAGHFIGNVNTQGNMYISGNTGIGTDSPGEKLEVDSGNVLIKGQQNFTTPGNQAILYLGDTNHSIRSQYAYGLIVDLWNTPNALIVRESTGNVGIGIDPIYKFEVAGPANINSGISDGTPALYVNNSEAIWYNGSYFSWGYGGINNYFADPITIGSASPATNYELTVSDDIYAYGTVSALTLVDRTPYPKDLKTAYDAVMSMERLPDGQYDQNNKEHQIDHSKLSHFIRTEDGNRDLSATVSCLNEVVKDLILRTQELEKANTTIQHLQQQVLELQKQNKRLEKIERQLKQLNQNNRQKE